MTLSRIGFACQFKHPQRELSLSELKALEGPLNPRTTTLRWMDSVSQAVAYAKLGEIVEHAQRLLDRRQRVEAVQLEQIDIVRPQPPQRRLLPFARRTRGPSRKARARAMARSIRASSAGFMT